MKKMIISALVTVFSLQSIAASVEWREIESKKCDNKDAVAVQNESVAVMSNHSLIAFKKKDESGCNYADFYSILMIASGQTNGKQFFIFQPAEAVSRKNCRNELSAAPPAFFSMVQASDDLMTLSNSEGCAQLELKLKPKASAPAETH